MAAPIIMVHGAFSGGWSFDDFRTPFEMAGHDCQAIDLPGHAAGGDRAAVTGLSMSQYAAAVVEAVKACPAPPILIGHSLGGLVAAMAAQRVPVARLIMLAPSAPWGVAGASLEEGASAISLYSLGAYWAQPIDPDSGLAREYSLDRFPAETRDAVFKRMGPESGRALWEVFNWWLDPFMTTQLSPSRSRAPVLVAVGGRDRIHPASTVRQTATLLGAAFEVFPEMSHWLIGEPGWETVARACLDWLAQEDKAAA
jgi:pimeloyl-ACP methyl ester carboxylesterase